MEPLNRSAAVRAKCLDCCCDQQVEVRECHIITCAIWPYRMGRQPSAKDLVKMGAKPRPPKVKEEKQNV